MNNAARTVIVLGMLLFLSPVSAGAGPGYDPSAEPQRSYAAIDVILYQTSW